MSFLATWSVSLHEVKARDGPFLLKAARRIQDPGRLPSARVCLANFWWRLMGIGPKYSNVQEKYDAQQPFRPWAVAELRDVILESRFAAGDRGAIDDLIQRDLDWLLEEAKKRLMPGINFDHEDSVHNVVLILLEKRGQYHPQLPFRPWLRTVLQNHIVDLARPRRGWSGDRVLRDWRTQRNRPVRNSDPSPLDALIDKEMERALKECLDALPESDQELVINRIYNSRTFKELAGTQSIIPRTLYGHYKSALKKLRDCLQRKGIHFS
jgi:RNA polymerase sigma factor (sigma-70 family)